MMMMMMTETIPQHNAQRLPVASLSFFQASLGQSLGIPTPLPSLNADILRPSRRRKHHQGKPPTHWRASGDYATATARPESSKPDSANKFYLPATYQVSKYPTMLIMHVPSFNRTPPSAKKDAVTTEFRAFISDDLEAVISAPTDSSIKWELRRYPENPKPLN